MPDRKCLVINGIVEAVVIVDFVVPFMTFEKSHNVSQKPGCKDVLPSPTVGFGSERLI